MKREELGQAAVDFITHTGRDFRLDDAPAIYTTAKMAQQRFTGVGGDKYQISEDEQAFERSSVPVMLHGLREELVDALNYLVMIDILLERGDKPLPLSSELAATLRGTAELLLDVDLDVQAQIEAIGSGLREGEDYVAALNREVGEGWEADRDA